MGNVEKCKCSENVCSFLGLQCFCYFNNYGFLPISYRPVCYIKSALDGRKLSFLNPNSAPPFGDFNCGGKSVLRHDASYIPNFRRLYVQIMLVDLRIWRPTHPKSCQNKQRRARETIRNRLTNSSSTCWSERYLAESMIWKPS